MQLREYLQKHQLTQATFGKRLTPPVSQGKVNHWINGTRRVSLVEALQIESLTGGLVSAEDLAGVAQNSGQLAQPVQEAVHGEAA
ncbi:MAG: hypothetical protein Q8S12_00435 [Hydrogenophaga sp.]|uniref:hypothetical protein n=1 Tax=Hydrogenophaga sp. TaxID=1904254 RepID=UPI002733979A|nr:hypothetical protein [Hydrogenophaga sp.]MDP3625033.1 hypothetical protein [Hydrogenophaga sp.]